MIKFENVFTLVRKNIKHFLKTEKVLVKNATAMVLAEDIISNINIPPQNNSAVDGYAMNYKYIKSIKDKKFKINQTIHAGEDFKKNIKKSECVKVSTGAHLPNYLDTVIMLENVKNIEKNIIQIPKSITQYSNVRKKGEDIKKGKIVLKKNILLQGQHVGILSALGIKEIKVYKKIKIGIFSNGNELVNPGIKKKKNQIYDSNRFMISSLLNTNTISCFDLGILKDNYIPIKNKIMKEKNNYDLLIISGGASFGDKDYIKKIIESNGKVLFSRVSIKPGRPFSIGLLKNKIPIIILPGNPVASFVTLNIFGKYLINHMLGKKNKLPSYFIVKSNFRMKKKIGREEFLRGKIFNKNNMIYVNKFKTEGAGILSSLTWANGLIRLKSNTNLINKNDNLEFYPFESFL